MAWIIPENKLDAQQRDFLDNVDITRKNVWKTVTRISL